MILNYLYALIHMTYNTGTKFITFESEQTSCLSRLGKK